MAPLIPKPSSSHLFAGLSSIQCVQEKPVLFPSRRCVLSQYFSNLAVSLMFGVFVAGSFYRLGGKGSDDGFVLVGG